MANNPVMLSVLSAISMIDRLILFGFALSFLGGVSYLVDTIKGRVQPNKVSWLVWSIAPMIAFWSEIHQGVKMEALLTFAVGFNPLLVFIASFFAKKSSWTFSPIDLICGALSIIGLVLWQLTTIGNLAIIFAIVADCLAAVPTVLKAYSEPESEDYLVFLLSGIASAMTLLTMSTWKFQNYAFPLYILTIDAILFALIKTKIGQIKSAP